MSASVTPLLGRRATNAEAAAAPEPEQQAHHPWLLGVCCLAQFMVILDVSIVNVALPSIHRSLGFSSSNLVWVVNAYTITFAGFLMLSGRAADLWGGRRTFVAGLLLFALASLAGGTAQTQGMLVGARALQGFGGAGMAAASLAIITHSYAAGPSRHRAIGLWGAMNGAGGAAGTLLGGVITQELTWRWVLLINLPIGLAAAAVAWVAVHEWRNENKSSFDIAGALTVTGGLLAFVYGIVSAGQHGWGSAAALVPIGIGVALLALFILIEARFASAPLVPLRVFRGPLLRSANGVVVLMSAAIFPMWFFASLYLQEVLGYGPLDTGLAFLPMALTIMACGTLAGGVVGRFGAGRVLASGLVLLAVGLALFARISVDGSYAGEFLPASLLVALGVGLSIVPSTIAATATAAPGEAGLVSGLVNTSRQMGGALGLALLATFSVQYAKHLIEVDYRAPLLAVNDGFRLAFGLGAGLSAIAALVAWLLIVRRAPQGQAPAAPVAAPAPASAAVEPIAPQPVPAPAAPVAPAAPPLAPATAAASASPLQVRLTSSSGGAWALGKGSCTLAYARRGTAG